MSRKLTISTAFVILMALSMAFSPIAMAASGAVAGGDGADEDASVDVDGEEVYTQSTDDVMVADELTSEVSGQSGDTIEVFVRMDAAESDFYSDFTGEDAPSANSQAELEHQAAVTQAQLELHAEQADGMEIVNEFWLTNAALVEIDTSQVDIDRLAEIDGVTELHPNYDVEMPEPAAADTTPADNGDDGDDVTYGLDQINAPETWEEFDTKGEDVTVAIIDTGVDPDHPEFADYDEDNWAEFAFDGSEINSTPYDVNGHGTHVAGTAVGGNASGTQIGVAPEAELLAINVFPGMPDEQSTTLASIVAGMEHAVEEGADVANLSLGGGGYAGVYVDVIQNAKAAGTIIVSSSGNSGPGSTGTPGNVYDGMGIGASNAQGGIADFSTGTEVNTSEEWGFIAGDDWPDEYVTPDVAAPGVDTFSSVPGGGYSDAFSGTSMAAPHVTGAVALLVSHEDVDLEGTEDADAIQDTLEETATKPAPDEIDSADLADAGSVSDQQFVNMHFDDTADVRYGTGIIDVYAATAAMADTDDVDGAVVDSDGDPIADRAFTEGELPDGSGATVTISDADRQQYALNGSFAFDTPQDEYDLHVSGAFGYADTTETVNDSPDDVEIELEDQLDVALLQNQPEETDEETFEVVVDVANLEELTVDLNDSLSENVAEEDVTVEFGGDELDLGEPEDLGDPTTTTVPLEVTVDTDEDRMVALDHTFTGLDDEVEATTGPTFVTDEIEELEPVIVEHETLEEDLISNQMRTGDITLTNPAEENQTVELFWDLEGVGAFPQEITLEPGEETTTNFDLSFGPDDPALWADFFSVGDTAEQQLIAFDEGGDPTYVEPFGTELTAGELSGTITDADTGEPLGGVTVMAMSADQTSLVETTTNADGEYHLNLDQAGEWYVMAESGTHGPAEGVVEINEDLDPVTEDIELGATPAFTLEMEAGETQTLGLPADVEGDTLGDIVDADAQAVFWAFDADENEWVMADANTSVGALDAFAVTAEEDLAVTVEFAGTPGASDTATPNQRNVSAGWNFVAPSTFDEPDAAFASSADDQRTLKIQDEPHSAMVPDGEFEGTTAHDGTDAGAVNPFAGYFVFFGDDGELAATTYDGMTMLEAYDNLNVNASPVEGHVVSNVDGQPIEGADIHVAGTTVSATTTADGHYAIPALPDDVDQAILADADGLVMDDQQVTPGDRADFDLDHEVYYAVTDLEVSETNVNYGDEIDVTAEIENKGVENGTQIVDTSFGPADDTPRMSDDAYALDSTVYELEPGETQEIAVDNAEIGDFVVPGHQAVTVWTGEDQATENVTVVDLEFNDQVLGQDDEENPAVLVEDVAAAEGDTVVVTYEDGDDLIVAGFEVLEDGADVEDVTVAIEDDGGFPGDHTAHVISDVSEGTLDTGEVSDETADNVRTNDAATVYDADLEFNDQVLGQDDEENPAVLVEDVAAAEGDTVVVTYEDEGDLIVAGYETLEDGAVGDGVTVAIEDDGGFPGDHTAHVISEVSEDTLETGEVSEETADNVRTNDAATVYDADLEFEDQDYAGDTDELEVATATLQDGDGDDTEFVVDVHPTDEDGAIIGDEAVGQSDDLTGENTDVTVTVGEIDETDDFVSMLHEGESDGPLTTPPIVALAGEEFVPVVDAAEVEITEENGETDAITPAPIAAGV